MDDSSQNNPIGTPQECRVVIIDASPSVVQCLGRMLKFDGHEVQTATDSRTGIALARQMQADVVVSCLHLPGLDGYQVASEIRNSLSQQPLLIVHTSHSQSAIGERAKAAGFDLYLAKPCSMKDLLRAVAVAKNATGCEDLRL